MKKTLALLLCLAMLVTALSVNVFAVEAPTVEVVTHESTASGDTTFAIKLSGFESLKGLDLTVTGDDGVTMVSASALNTKSALAVGENYTISEDQHTLHIVELSDDLNGDIITVAAKVNVDGASHKVTVTGEFAKSGEELYVFDEETFSGEITPFVKSEKVEVTIPDEQTETTVSQENAGENYFIPYGAVYNGTEDAPEYLGKDAEGKFVVSANTTVVKFPVPDNGFGTYGVSDGIINDNGKETPAKQFGNYVAEYKPETRTYGTFVIVGDWSAYRDWYLKNKAYSDADLINKIYTAYTNKIKTDKDGKHSYIPYGIDLDKDNEADYVIQVMEVEQNKYLWKNDTQLEYGVRFKGLFDGKEYATVALYKEGDATKFAKEIRVDKHN